MALKPKKRIIEESLEDAAEQQGLGPDAGGQSGDLQGLSGIADADSEGVEQRIEQGRLSKQKRWPAWRMHGPLTCRRPRCASALRAMVHRSTSIKCEDYFPIVRTTRKRAWPLIIRS